MPTATRIRKTDSQDSNNTRFYYYNNNWQVLYEYTDSNTLYSSFMYGNYIDEAVFAILGSTYAHYAHDHLYSPAALIDHGDGSVLERYEYDAYGEPNILDADFSKDADGLSDYDNNYLFTGRRLDILDNGSLKIQYNRNRYYGYHTGRWLTHDPVGYADGLNLYEYVLSNPVTLLDPLGTSCTGGSCRSGGSSSKECPRVVEGPFAKVKSRKVWWDSYFERSKWIPPFGHWVDVYKEVDYQVDVITPITIIIVGETHWGSCESSPLITFPVRSYKWPTHQMVVESLKGKGGVWNPEGKRYSCKKFYKCRQKCCYKRTWEIEWNAEQLGVLEWDTLHGIPYCKVYSENAKDICRDWQWRCICPALM